MSRTLKGYNSITHKTKKKERDAGKYVTKNAASLKRDKPTSNNKTKQ